MMKKTVALIITVIVLAAAVSGCIAFDKGGKEADKILQKTQDEAKTNDATDQTEAPEPTATVEPTPQVTAVPTERPSVAGILYQNEKFGFSIEFPRSWEGKFSISEFDNGISVTFRPGVPIEEGRGHLFSLVKNPTEDEASFLDGAQWIQTDDASYVYGGPTDVTYEEQDPEYDTFVEMRDQISEIMKTLK